MVFGAERDRLGKGHVRPPFMARMSAQSLPLGAGSRLTVQPIEDARSASASPAALPAPPSSLSVAMVKGFAKRNAEDLVRRGLAKRQADGCIVPMGFVTQRMLEAYEREKKSFPACKGFGARVPVEAHGADAEEAAGEAHLSISAVAQELRVTAKTVGYLVENGLLHGVDAAELYRRGATVVTAGSLMQFREIFISLGQLADVAQRPQGALSMRLRNADVALLAMPHDLSRIYWREDVSV
ncbi:hypothetical protein C357_14232 [Citreicella sp. 357]|nr:hypothetical protein C357_14232 [Citreicella sp. 357]